MATIKRVVSDRTGAVTWLVRYRTPAGGSRSKSFKLKRDASTFANQVEVRKDSGQFVDPQLAQVTVGEWSTRWLAGRTNLAATTRQRYQEMVEGVLADRWGDVKLSAVRHEDVQEWVAELGADRKPATVRKIHRVLSMALDFAVASRRLATNPAKGISLPRVQDAEKRYLTHRQVEQLADAVGPAWALLVRFLAYTGVRFGEAAALRVERVDLDRRRVLIVSSATMVRGKLVEGPTKGYQRREVPIPPFLAGELAEHVAGLRPGELVFVGPRGAQLRSSTFRPVLAAAAEVLGICEPKLGVDGQQVTRTNAEGVVHVVMTKHLHPHELRHTAASLAIASGADVKVVQQMLGHKSATMTLDLYGHLFPDRLDVVADALDAARRAALGLAA